MDTARRIISLTVDVEEFDTALDYGYPLLLEEQIALSTSGLRPLMERLDEHWIPATLFTTATYALNEWKLMRELGQFHEVASHGFRHGSLGPGDLLASRLALESVTNKPVVGFRRAQMGPVNERELREAGYRYNASLHPTWLPGRYNHLTKPRLPFQSGGILHLPASVTPRLRIPLFWLSLKNFPFSLYCRLCVETLWANGHLNLYVHPWEFTDLSGFPRIPFYIRRHAGEPLLDRLDQLIHYLRPYGEFGTLQTLAQTIPALTD
ncbi:MAG: polysaccharide deacetylase family protein [Rudanella sp.]|nr:polysaccharide deacetylase family protein [Rudanella sp.]